MEIELFNAHEADNNIFIKRRILRYLLLFLGIFKKLSLFCNGDFSVNSSSDYDSGFGADASVRQKYPKTELQSLDCQ